MKSTQRERLLHITKKDFKEDVFRAGGKGGQKQNKTSSGVRLTHLESGAVGESREHREQHQNRKTAFRKCIDSEKFQSWLRKEIAVKSMTEDEKKRRHQQMIAAIDKAMAEDNLLIEGKDEEGRWQRLK